MKPGTKAKEGSTVASRSPRHSPRKQSPSSPRKQSPSPRKASPSPQKSPRKISPAPPLQTSPKSPLRRRSSLTDLKALPKSKRLPRAGRNASLKRAISMAMVQAAVLQRSQSMPSADILASQSKPESGISDDDKRQAMKSPVPPLNIADIRVVVSSDTPSQTRSQPTSGHANRTEPIGHVPASARTDGSIDESYVQNQQVTDDEGDETDGEETQTEEDYIAARAQIPHRNEASIQMLNMKLKAMPKLSSPVVNQQKKASADDASPRRVASAPAEALVGAEPVAAAPTPSTVGVKQPDAVAASTTSAEPATPAPNAASATNAAPAKANGGCCVVM